MELLKEMELPQYGVQLRRGKSVDSKENVSLRHHHQNVDEQSPGL